MAYVDAFWNKVEKTDDCWLWTGARDKNGYGIVQSPFGKSTARAHRVSYYFERGPIPDGLVIDHLCRNPSCVRPEHLEAVSQRENVIRGVSTFAVNSKKTHCIKGHEFIESNIVYEGTRRHCRTCRQNTQKKRAEAFRDSQKKPKPTEEELVLLLKAGNTWTSIALTFGVTDSAVRKWAVNYGIVKANSGARSRT